MQAIIGLMDLSRRWPLAYRNPVRRWSTGRVTHLGDSAHATLQSLAEGAGMAIEDAVHLAHLLKSELLSIIGKFDLATAIKVKPRQLTSPKLTFAASEAPHFGGNTPLGSSSVTFSCSSRRRPTDTLVGSRCRFFSPHARENSPPSAPCADLHEQLDEATYPGHWSEVVVAWPNLSEPIETGLQTPTRNYNCHH